MIKPSYVSLSEWVTFWGGSLPEVMRLAADYIEQEKLSDIGGFEVSHDEDASEAEFGISFTGRTKNGVGLPE